MQSPSEDPQAKADRERERRVAAAERNRAAQKSASSMTSDYSQVYMQPSLFR